jgi:hypothetical protein
MKIGRGNRSTRSKPAPAPLCPPQIPHEWTWVRTRAAVWPSTYSMHDHLVGQGFTCCVFFK